MKHTASVLILFLAGLLSSAPEAAPVATTIGLGPLVQSKEAMVARLLEGSSLVRQLETSGVPDVLALVEEARRHHQEANQAIGAGQLEAANGALDLAMQKIQEARKRAPGNARVPSASPDRLAGLTRTVETLRRSYVQHLGTKPGANDALLTEVDGDIARSRQETADGQASAALQTLLGAEKKLTGGLLGRIGSSTVEYRRTPLSPSEAFHEELARNHAYAELVPIAIEQLRPPVDRVRNLQVQLDLNRAARERATTQSASDPSGATALLEDSTRAIEAALQAAGLTLPGASRE